MIHPIRLAVAEDYPRIMEIWESAVQATHHFLSEEDLCISKKSFQRIPAES
jgi:putative acetyltransferase